MRKSWLLIAFVLSSASTAISNAGEFTLVTGANANKYPGADRFVAPSPGPGFPGTFRDGDRLAGTSDVGVTASFVGQGTPLYQPNHLGSLSFLFRRGSIPAGGANRVPILGIDFLGGPLLDLDGNSASPRSLAPVVGQSPVEIPAASSHVDLSVNLGGLTVTLANFDATGTNEGGPGIQAEIATVLVTLAGTAPDGQLGAAINSSIDTRAGSLLAHTGPSGTLKGVYRISNLGFELWYDSIDPNSSTADQLGTLQHLGTFRGWLVLRDCFTGQFPTLAGQNMGGTLWPSVNSALIGRTLNTAIDVFGLTATIASGNSSDVFTAANNGGAALADSGGDIGAYFDTVVKPLLDPQAQAFVYLEAAGAGINNSGDPVFGDTTGYDVVVVAASNQAVPGIPGDVDGDGALTTADADALVNVLLDSGTLPACAIALGDVNGDGQTDSRDLVAFVDMLVQ